MDYGHKWTDEELKKLEKRIAKIYAQATKETQKKLDDYLAAFKVKDKIKRDQLAKGIITQQEYDHWRTGQIMMGKRWEEMKDTLAEDMHTANLKAASMTKQFTYDAYALNHNYGTFEVEKGSLIDTSYTLYDRHTVERLVRDDPQLLPPPGKKVSKAIAEGRAKLWNKQVIQSVMTQSILQGESIPKIATRLAEAVGDSNRKAAIRNARTMTTGAENAGRVDSYKRAESMGIKMQQMWVATLDGRTRHEHRQLDGMRVDVGKPFEIDGYTIHFPGDPTAAPEMVYNCFVGETSAYTDCDIFRSYKHKYDGELIKIKTASGIYFTCTPNHPILTLNGWVSAASLHNGDDLLVTRIRNSGSGRRNSNIQHILPSMKAFHNSFKRVGLISRNASLCVNFHGDIPTSEVEIVTQKRLLSDNRNSSVCECIIKFLFKLADKTFSCKCSFMKHFWSVGLSALRIVCGRNKVLSFFTRHFGHSQKHSLRPIALFDTFGVKPLQDNIAGDVQFLRKCINGFIGVVFADNIVSVDRCSGCTHVYNLQTKNGYYLVNTSISQNKSKVNDFAVFSHNCRCTLVGVVAGTDLAAGKFERRSKLGDMTYEEWKDAKRKKSV